MALLISLSFFLGVLYRPASLYHPQRRAILHLKSLQKRSRLKDQHLKTATAQNSLNSAFSSVAVTAAAGTNATNNNSKKSNATVHAKKTSDKPPYFDFSVLKSRTIQIILSGTCISHFGMTAPLFLLVSPIISLSLSHYLHAAVPTFISLLHVTLQQPS